MRVLLLFTLFMFSLHAQNNCPEAASFQNVDLRPTLPPLRHQDSIGWCASFGSADLFSQWMDRNKQRLGMSSVNFTLRENMISAAGAAFTFNNSGYRENKRFDLYEDELIRANLVTELETLRTTQGELKNQLITEGKSPSENQSFQQNKAAILLLREQLDDLPAYKEPTGGLITKVIKSLAGGQLFWERDLPSDSYEFSNIEDTLAALYNLYSPQGDCLSGAICQTSKLLQQTFPNQSLIEIGGIISQGFDQGQDPIVNLIHNNPGGFTIDPEIFPRTTTLGGRSKNRDSLWSELHQSLQTGKLVGISYAASILLPEPVSPDGHVSTLAGVTYNCQKGEPIYILRNSWGEQRCDAAYEIILAKKMEVMSESEAKLVMPFKCDNGYYLVPQSILASSMGTLYTID